MTMTTTLSKSASVKLPGMGKLWKKKKIPLREQTMQQARKTAAVKLKPGRTGILGGLGKIKDWAGTKTRGAWNRAGGSGYKTKARQLDLRSDDLRAGRLHPDLDYDARVRQDKRYDNLADKYDSAARRAKTTRNIGVPAAVAAGSTYMLNDWGGDQPANKSKTTPASQPGAENARLKQRTDSPFGGLWDDLMNPESDDDVTARSARLSELGDKATLMDRWKLADPTTRSLLMALLLFGGGSMLGAMRR